MRMLNHREAVERGAKFLDEHHPDWWRQINLGILDLNNSCNCVLGQLFTREDSHLSGYLWAVEHILPAAASPYYMGFAAFRASDYAELDELWIEQIKTRWETLA